MRFTRIDLHTYLSDPCLCHIGHCCCLDALDEVGTIRTTLLLLPVVYCTKMKHIFGRKTPQSLQQKVGLSYPSYIMDQVAFYLLHAVLDRRVHKFG